MRSVKVIMYSTNARLLDTSQNCEMPVCAQIWLMYSTEGVGHSAEARSTFTRLPVARTYRPCGYISLHYYVAMTKFHLLVHVLLKSKEYLRTKTLKHN